MDRVQGLDMDMDRRAVHMAESEQEDTAAMHVCSPNFTDHKSLEVLGETHGLAGVVCLIWAVRCV